MKKILDFINANLGAGFIILSFIFLFQTCTLNSNIKSTRKEMSLLRDSVLTKNEFIVRSEIEGYKINSRDIYYQNAIVRTKERPDDIINLYSTKIEELNKKLK